MSAAEPVCHTLSCGATLAVEHMPGARSTAVAWLLPVGTSGDAPEREGESTVLSELILRGAGPLPSRDLSNAFDALGAQRHGSPAVHHISLGALCLGDRLHELLRLLTLVVRQPRLEPASLDAVRALAVQALDSLKDEPQQLAGLALREHAMPAPFNRSGFGTHAGLAALSAEGLQAAWRRRAVPGGTIIGIAGDVHAERTRDELERLLAGWTGTAVEQREAAPAGRGRHLVRVDTQQTHMALGMPAPRDGHPAAYALRVASRVLGGATSSRLFTEVREKRGLCYSVGSSLALGRDRGLMQVYAGSTHERAARTLECIHTELARFEQGITAEEFELALVGAKSALVMAGESTSARAMAIASSVYRCGRAESLREVAAEFERLTLPGVNAAIAEHMGAAWRSEETLVIVAPEAPEGVTVAG
jgi:predicted Zn-dependent peptidase